MLMNLHKKGWTEGLKLTDFEKHHEGNEESVKVSIAPATLSLWAAQHQRLYGDMSTDMAHGSALRRKC